MLIVQYRDITTKELFFEKHSNFIPNVNDRIVINGNKLIVGFVVDKIINIYPNDDANTYINVYIKQSY